MKIIGMIDTCVVESIFLIPPQCSVVLLHEMKIAQSTQGVFILLVRSIVICNSGPEFTWYWIHTKFCSIAYI